MVSRPPLMLGTWVQIPMGLDYTLVIGKVGLDSRHTNARMRGEEITNCKSHIASVSLTYWCIMIFSFLFFKVLLIIKLELICCNYTFEV